MELQKQRLLFVNKSPFEDPKYAHEGDSCFDVRAWIQDDFTGIDKDGKKFYELKPLERHLFHTGLYFIIPPHREIQARPRSGCALNLALCVANSPGTIDSRYRGEAGVIAINLSNETIKICDGDRIAQMGLYPVYDSTLVDFEKVESVDPTSTERGDTGYGASGMK